MPTAPPTVAPPPAEKPPPPPPPPPPAPDCPTYDGENAPFAEVRAALQAAASKHYWQGVRKPPEYEGADGTDIEIPFNFVKAIAYQESGWQSAIQACDGGMGTMQLMPATIDHLNQRFGMGYSIPLDLQENAEAGVNYLQWLLMYFGLYYYGHNFDPFVAAYNVGPDGQPLMLIDVVVAAYNVGPGALERKDGDTYYLQIPNWNYVNAVWRFAMEDCPCDDL